MEFFISFIISGLNGKSVYKSCLLAILKSKFQNFVKFEYFRLLSLHTTFYIALYGNTRTTCIHVILKTYKNKLPDFQFLSVFQFTHDPAIFFFQYFLFPEYCIISLFCLLHYHIFVLTLLMIVLRVC